MTQLGFVLFFFYWVVIYRFYLDTLTPNTNIVGWQELEDFKFFSAVKLYSTDKSGFIKSSELDQLAKHVNLSRTTLVSKLKASPYFTYCRLHGYKLMSWTQAKAIKNIKSKYRILEADDVKALTQDYINLLLQSTCNQVQFKDHNRQTIFNSMRLETLRKKVQVLPKKRRNSIAIVETALRTELKKGVFAKMMATKDDVAKLHKIENELEQKNALRIIRGKAGFNDKSGQANIFVWGANDLLPKKALTHNAFLKKMSTVQINITPTRVKKEKKPTVYLSELDLLEAFYMKLVEHKEHLMSVGVIKQKMSRRSISNVIAKMKEMNMQNILDALVDPELVKYKEVLTIGGLCNNGDYLWIKKKIYFLSKERDNILLTVPTTPEKSIRKETEEEQRFRLYQESGKTTLECIRLMLDLA